MSNEAQTYPRGEADGPNPLAIIVPILIVGVAIFLLTRRNGHSGAIARGAGDTAAKTTRQAQRKGGSAGRRMLLTLAINALENDAARRAVITGLKIVRSRS